MTDSIANITASQHDAFPGIDVPWLLDQWLERQPDKTFVIWAPFDDAATLVATGEPADELGADTVGGVPIARDLAIDRKD